MVSDTVAVATPPRPSLARTVSAYEETAEESSVPATVISPLAAPVANTPSASPAVIADERSASGLALTRPGGSPGGCGWSSSGRELRLRPARLTRSLRSGALCLLRLWPAIGRIARIMRSAGMSVVIPLSRVPTAARSGATDVSRRRA